MNKQQLIEAIKDYPDDAPVVVSGGLSELIECDILSGTDGRATIWSVSSDPAVINLEL